MLVVQAAALGVAVLLLTAAMAAQTMDDGPIVAAATWLLLPGLLLYATIHGSLLSGGSGLVADFLVVVVGSAALWSALYTALHVATSQVLRRFSATRGEGGPSGRREGPDRER